MNLGQVVHKAVVKSNRNIFPVVHRENNTLLGIILLDDIRSIMFDQTIYETVYVRDLMQKPPAIIKIESDKMTEIMKKFQKNSGGYRCVFRAAARRKGAPRSPRPGSGTYVGDRVGRLSDPRSSPRNPKRFFRYSSMGNASPMFHATPSKTKRDQAVTRSVHVGWRVTSGALTGWKSPRYR